MQKKYFSRYREPLAELPNMVEAQVRSYDWITKEGLKELFEEAGCTGGPSLLHRIDDCRNDEHNEQARSRTVDEGVPLRGTEVAQGKQRRTKRDRAGDGKREHISNDYRRCLSNRLADLHQHLTRNNTEHLFEKRARWRRWRRRGR
jgi:hypothetical protein